MVLNLIIFLFQKTHKMTFVCSFSSTNSAYDIVQFVNMVIIDKTNLEGTIRTEFMFNKLKNPKLYKIEIYTVQDIQSQTDLLDFCKKLQQEDDKIIALEKLKHYLFENKGEWVTQSIVEAMRIKTNLTTDHNNILYNYKDCELCTINDGCKECWVYDFIAELRFLSFYLRPGFQYFLIVPINRETTDQYTRETLGTFHLSRVEI
nr:hypothetical protein [Abalone asfa-like virus]